jgi:hypothetical protein
MNDFVRYYLLPIEEKLQVLSNYTVGLKQNKLDHHHIQNCTQNKDIESTHFSMSSLENLFGKM